MKLERLEDHSLITEGLGLKRNWLDKINFGVRLAKMISRQEINSLLHQPFCK